MKAPSRTAVDMIHPLGSATRATLHSPSAVAVVEVASHSAITPGRQNNKHSQ